MANTKSVLGTVPQIPTLDDDALAKLLGGQASALPALPTYQAPQVSLAPYNGDIDPSQSVGGVLGKVGLLDPSTGLPTTGSTPGAPAPTSATNPLAALQDTGRPQVESRQMRLADTDYDRLAKIDNDYAQPAQGVFGHIAHLLRPSLNAAETPVRERIAQDEQGLREQGQLNNAADKELNAQAEFATPEAAATRKAALEETTAKTRAENATADQLENGKFTIEKTAQGLVRVNGLTGEAQPVTANGQPVGVPLETELATYVPAGGTKPHTFLVSKTDGSPIKDLGEHYEKPTTVNVNQGTWQLGIDPTTGKPALFNNKTGETKAGPENFVKPTGTQQDASFRAQVGDQLRQKLYTELQDPAIRGQLGPLLGRAKNFEEFIGNLPPELAEFGQDLNSYAAFQAGLHPVRGIGALEYFDKKLGGLGQTPEQLEGKLKSGEIVSQTVENLAGKRGSDKQDQLPAAAASQLKEGTHTTFGNGQVWTKKNGKPERIS